MLHNSQNVGNAFISNDLYISSAYNFLNSDITFERLLSNPLQDTVIYINTEIQKLCNNGHLSEKLRKIILYDINNSILGSFRLLAKLHKPTFSWRPIVNCKEHPNSKICFVIDYILKQIVMKTETYLKDSQNLIQKINNLYFEEEPYLYSLDIVSLYTNINQLHAIDTITEFMSRYLDNFHIDIIGFNVLLKIMFNSNVFMFDENFFKQIYGLPMGCICGPSIANIYVYILEIKWFYIERPLIYVRFIDDTFMALKNKLNLENFQNYFINLKFTENSDKIVNFLDLNIWYDKITNKLETSVYLKPTNNFSYLDINSDHPEHIFKNIPNCIIVRDRKICSNYSDYVLITRKHIEQLNKLYLFI